MTDENQRAAQRRQRMNELLAEAETDVARTRASNGRAGESGPVVAQRRGTFRGSVLGVLMLAVIAAVLGMTAMTIGRFTGADFQDADRVGTATVESCERQGPVGFKGFGYYDECVVKVAWNTGLTSRLRIDEPGFIQGEGPGDTFEIGQNSGNRGGTSYSRPESPDRDWLGWVGAFIGFLAVLPALAIVFYLRASIRSLLHRRQG